MANDRVEIYDPLTINGSQISTPKTNMEPEPMTDSLEFKLLMAYTKRRRPDSTVASPQHSDSTGTPGGLSSSEGLSSPDTVANRKDSQTRKKNKKKKGVKLSKIFSCFKPQIKDELQADSEDNKSVDIKFKSCNIDQGQYLTTSVLEKLGAVSQTFRVCILRSARLSFAEGSFEGRKFCSFIWIFVIF